MCTIYSLSSSPRKVNMTRKYFIAVFFIKVEMLEFKPRWWLFVLLHTDHYATGVSSPHLLKDWYFYASEQTKRL
jgi:hypothetical protein